MLVRLDTVFHHKISPGLIYAVGATIAVTRKQRTCGRVCALRFQRRSLDCATRPQVPPSPYYGVRRSRPNSDLALSARVGAAAAAVLWPSHGWGLSSVGPSFGVLQLRGNRRLFKVSSDVESSAPWCSSIVSAQSTRESRKEQIRCTSHIWHISDYACFVVCGGVQTRQPSN
jgi:hypothetical protein